MAEKYDDLARSILENVGGAENVTSVAHCITRVRFKLKDESRANTAKIEALKGVIQVIQANGQYQVVVGNIVEDVYDALSRHKEAVFVCGLSAGRRKRRRRAPGREDRDLRHHRPHLRYLPAHPGTACRRRHHEGTACPHHLLRPGLCKRRPLHAALHRG